MYFHKDHFHKKDFEKQYDNITKNLYSNDIEVLLRPFGINVVKWGIGISDSKYSENVHKHEYMIDFLYTVDEKRAVYIKKNY